MTHQPPTTAGAVADPAVAGRGISRRVAWWVLAGALVLGLPVWFYLLRDLFLFERLATLHRGWLLLAGACLGIWTLLATTPADAARLSPRLSKRIILPLCAVVAAGALLWLKPVLSNEVLRYRFDARIWLLGQSPYTVSPAEAAALAADAQDPELRPDSLDLAAPSPGRTSLNLPVSQAAFVATRTLEYLSPQAAEGRAQPGVEPDWRRQLLAMPWWRGMLFWRCLLAGAFLLTVGELIAWLRHRHLSPWWAVAFAWQPLVLVETLGAGHQEMLGVMFLVAGLRRTDMGNFRRAGICLAAAVAVKPLALLALPFVLRRAWRGDRIDLEPAAGAPPAPVGSAAAARRMLAWFLAALIVLLAPIWAGGGLFQFAGAAGDYFASAGHDASLYRLLESMFVGPEASAERLSRVRLAAWIICALATLLAWLISWQRHVRPAAAFYAMTVIGLLTSPAATPWMLIWPLAVVPLLRGRAGPTALVWAGTAALYYAPETLMGGRLPGQLMLLQLAPVYVVALLEALVTSRHSARLRRRRSVEARRATPAALAGT